MRKRPKKDPETALVIRMAEKMGVPIQCRFCKKIIHGKEFRRHIASHLK